MHTNTRGSTWYLMANILLYESSNRRGRSPGSLTSTSSVMSSRIRRKLPCLDVNGSVSSYFEGTDNKLLYRLFSDYLILYQSDFFVSVVL